MVKKLFKKKKKEEPKSKEQDLGKKIITIEMFAPTDKGQEPAISVTIDPTFMKALSKDNEAMDAMLAWFVKSLDMTIRPHKFAIPIIAQKSKYAN